MDFYSIDNKTQKGLARECILFQIQYPVVVNFFPARILWLQDEIPAVPLELRFSWMRSASPQQHQRAPPFQCTLEH